MEKIFNTYFKDFISGYSIEVIPRSAAKIESFVDVLPRNTRVYIAHIQKEDITAMVATAKRLHDEIEINNKKYTNWPNNQSYKCQNVWEIGRAHV